MRRIRLIALVAAIAIAGCSDDDSSRDVTEGGTLPSAPTTTAPKGDAKKLAELVLVAADFPSGWTASAADEADDEAAEALATCSGGSSPSAAAAEFSGPDFAKDSDQISSDALIVKNDVDYAKDVAAITGPKFGPCLKDQLNKEVEKQLAGQTVTIDVADLAVPRHGDLSVGRRLTVTVGSGAETLKLFADFVLMGKKRIELSASFFGAGRPVDDALRATLIEKLGARLDAAPEP